MRSRLILVCSAISRQIVITKDCEYESTISSKIFFCASIKISLFHQSQLETKILGVYAARVDISGQCSYLAVANIGKRPTFNSTEKISFELHLLDFEGDLYGKKLNVTLVYFLREEKAFPHIDLLKSQIEQDISTTREYNAHNKVIS